MIIHYPKCGSVWLEAMIRSALDLPASDKPQDQLQVVRTSSEFENKRLFDQRILRGAIMVRDLRDIVVSLFHYTKVPDFAEREGSTRKYNSIEDMYYGYFVPYYSKFVCNPTSFWKSYIEHGWPAIRYESLVASPEEELKRLFDIWGVPINGTNITRAVEENTLTKMKRGGGRVGQVSCDHFRRGIAGSHVDELPDIIRKDIEERFSEYMKGWGYV